MRPPNPLFDDPTYPSWICPLTKRPILLPVLDPTDGKTLYERAAIIRNLGQAPLSPITGQMLPARFLLEVPQIARYVKERIAIFGKISKKRLHWQMPLNSSSKKKK